MPATDYNALFDEALDTLPRLSFGRWTDYNATDPGITMLEMLCYALTDIGYRLDFSIPDLLASDPSSSTEPYSSLYRAARILTCSPVTIEDLRRAAVDCEGAKNAWVGVVENSVSLGFCPNTFELSVGGSDEAPDLSLSGILKVDLQSDLSGTGTTLEQSVRARLHASRPTCMDFQKIAAVRSEPIGILATVQLDPLVDSTKLLTEIYLACEAFVTPSIRRHTLQEETASGRRSEEIFEGPEMRFGFIDRRALSLAPRHTELHSSDLIRVIADLPGVAVVRSLAMTTGGEPESWVLELSSDTFATLDPDLCEIDLVCGVTPLEPNRSRAADQYDEISTQKLVPLPDYERDIAVPEGRNRAVATYSTIREQFPQVYGIGQGDLPLSATDSRIAASKQLTAYLMVFEQFLANDLSQLAHVGDLLGFGADPTTYFVQPLEGSNDFTVGMADAPDIASATDLHRLSENDEEAEDRKLRFLTHLLARFGETRVGADLPELEENSNFLSHLRELGGARFTGFDLMMPAWETQNVGGFKKRLCQLLGIRDATERSLAGGDSLGFHVVEHLLLRPRTGDLDEDSDPAAHPISLFESTENETTRCTTDSIEGLSEGVSIVVAPAPSDSPITVSNIDTSSKTFVIDACFDEDPPTTGNWALADPVAEVLPFLTLGESITTVSESDQGSGFVTCASMNPPADSSHIEVVGTGDYDGEWTVSATTATSFDIPTGFTTDLTGSWGYRDQPKDPFSNQLSLIFPATIGAFADDSHRAFIESTIAAETPAHLTVYLHWMDDTELSTFEQSYQPWIESFAGNAGTPDFSRSLEIMELLGIGHPVDPAPV